MPRRYRSGIFENGKERESVLSQEQLAQVARQPTMGRGGSVAGRARREADIQEHYRALKDVGRGDATPSLAFRAHPLQTPARREAAAELIQRGRAQRELAEHRRHRERMVTEPVRVRERGATARQEAQQTFAAGQAEETRRAEATQAESERKLKMGLANLSADTQTNITNMRNESQRWLAQAQSLQQSLDATQKQQGEMATSHISEAEQIGKLVGELGGARRPNVALIESLTENMKDAYEQARTVLGETAAPEEALPPEPVTRGAGTLTPEGTVEAPAAAAAPAPSPGPQLAPGKKYKLSDGQLQLPGGEVLSSDEVETRVERLNDLLKETTDRRKQKLIKADLAILDAVQDEDIAD